MNDHGKISKEQEMKNDMDIDLVDLLKTLWKERRITIKSIIIFTILGLLIAIFSEKEYEASSTMVPQIDNQPQRLGGLTSLASLAGFDINLNSETGTISPILYPKIISSVNFQLEIMNTEFLFEEVEEPISLLEYYTNVYKPGFFGLLKKYTLGLPGVLRSSLRQNSGAKAEDSKSEIIMLTREQYDLREILDKRINLVINDQDGSITLSSRFHQASLSAQLAKKTQELLQEYLTNFKIEKAEAQLAFIKERYEENKIEFEEAQSNLAAFRDANKNISSEFMRSNEERLQSEYQLAFDVYSELAKQLEQALIKVEEDTPVFSVIKEVVIPSEKSKPKRSLIVLISFFSGGIIGIVWIFGLRVSRTIRKKWDSADEI